MLIDRSYKPAQDKATKNNIHHDASRPERTSMSGRFSQEAIDQLDGASSDYIVFDVDLDGVFAEVEEAKQAKAMVADGAKKQRGNREVAVCGDTTVWKDDSDDEEERAKARKKVKAIQKGVVKKMKAPEDNEGGRGGDQYDWFTHLLGP
ncbi:MAG: hypothetical protein JOS17DRAFT_786227 [Linnemannia elongata]|nr:MAG: hypothetical protein JOS17DRAFT_786227 [Linnemannia elongata]